MNAEQETDWKNWDFCIRIAGNTGPRALFALWQKGYAIRHRSFERAKSDYQNEYEAKKDGRLFSATSAEELLGLVAIWETRGENWQDATETEWTQYDELTDNAKIYDVDGNVDTDT